MWWCVRWTAALLLFVAVMAGAGYLVYSRALEGGAYVEVPEVTNRPITEASFAIAERGLEMKQTMVPSTRVPKYYIMSQRPPAGRVIREGRKVFVTVSAGNEIVHPPDLVGKVISDPVEELRRENFQLGNVARIDSEMPRDTVLAQDPGPERMVTANARINLLLSEGPPEKTFIMPNIVGMALEEMNKVLEPLGVKATANTVHMPGQQTDVVLDQQPAAGTLIQEGEQVTYTVFPSEGVTLPDVRQTVEVAYTVPASWFEREVRIDTIDRNDARETIFPQEQHYVDGRPPRLRSGMTVRLQVTFPGSVTVEIYLDGQLAEKRVYDNDAPPVVSKYNVP